MLDSCNITTPYLVYVGYFFLLLVCFSAFWNLIFIWKVPSMSGSSVRPFPVEKGQPYLPRGKQTALVNKKSMKVEKRREG